MTERSVSERAELVALADHISAHLKHATSPVLWSKDMELIITALRSLAAQDQKPVAYRWRVVGDSSWTIVKTKPVVNAGSPARFEVEIEPLFVSPPPAAGWDEKIALSVLIDDADAVILRKFDPDNDAVLNDEQHLSIVEALRHNAPPDSGAEKSASDYHAIWDALENAPRRLPDHGGADAGVSEQIRGWIEFSETETAQKMTVAEVELVNGESLGDTLRRVEVALSKPAPVAAIDPRWRTELDEIIGHLGAAVIQSIASDDQIIMDHVKSAHEIAKVIRRQA